MNSYHAVIYQGWRDEEGDHVLVSNRPLRHVIYHSSCGFAADEAAVSPTPAPVQAVTTMTYADAPAKPNQAVSERGGAAILEPASTTPMPVASSPSDAPGQVAPPAAGEPQYHRFYGSVKINPRMMALDAGKIMEEVVKHLTTLYGANVQVTLEIQATLPGGAPESTRRTVEENCRTLRFEGYGFEEE